MAKDKNNKLFEKKVAAFYTVKMFEGIPEDLRNLFVPEDVSQLIQLEMNIVKWLARVQEREKVMQIQKFHNLPLRPNQSLRDVTICLNILELRKKRKRKSGDNDFKPDKDNGQ